MPATPVAPSSTIVAVADCAARRTTIMGAGMALGIAGMTIGPVVVASASRGEGLSDVGKLTNGYRCNRGKKPSD
ncbi:MAG: hypothetical protein ACR2H5_08445 [Ktedonobacteraceae bacterium]